VTDPEHISRQVTEIIMSIALSLCIKYHIKNTGNGFEKTLGKMLQKCHAYIENYFPLFHPQSYLLREIASCYTKWDEFFEIHIPNKFKYHWANNHRILKTITEEQLEDLVHRMQQFIHKKYGYQSIFYPRRSKDNFAKPQIPQYKKLPQIPKQFTGKIGNNASPVTFK
jgi:hypothetical protein